MNLLTSPPPPLATQRTQPAPFTWRRAVAVNFAPGIATIALITAMRPMINHFGWPPVAGYTAAIAIVTVLELLYLGHCGRTATGRFSVRSATTFRTRLRTRRVLLVSIGFVGITAALAALLQPVADAIVTATSFVPDWLSPDVTDAQVATYGRTTLVVALIAKLIIDAFINPLVEELYWKGHLMARLPVSGLMLPLAAGVLFSAEHFWQPSEFLLVAIIQTALCWYTLRTRSLDVAIATHWIVNGLVTVLALVSVLR